jgi:hypothetical protein
MGDHSDQKNRYVVMNTPSAMISTTCKGTPSGWADASSSMVPTSVPATVLPSSDSARFLRLKPVASVGTVLGSGAAANSARRR